MQLLSRYLKMTDCIAILIESESRTELANVMGIITLWVEFKLQKMSKLLSIIQHNFYI